MGFASHAISWDDGGSLHTRLQTNLSAEALRRRLEAVGLTGAASEIDQHPDLLGLNGGSYLLVRWAKDAERVAIARFLAANARTAVPPGGPLPAVAAPTRGHTDPLGEDS